MKTNHILWLSALLWVVAACGGDDPECPAQPPVTAEFTMSKRFQRSVSDVAYRTIDTVAISNTFLVGDPIIFQAPPGFDRYEWQVGYDDRAYTDSVFTLFFQETQEDLPVRLIVQGEPETDCFPDDDGIDTLTQYLTVLDVTESALVGRYYGHHVGSPTDTFTVEIVLRDFIDDYFIINLNPGCVPRMGSDYGGNMRRGYDFTIFYERSWPGSGCSLPFGWTSLSSDHQQLTVGYSTRKQDWRDREWEDRFDYFTFVGQRIE